MMQHSFSKRLEQLQSQYEQCILRPNEAAGVGNGIYARYVNPVLTAAHTPLHWRYDLDEKTNPYLMERYGINAVFKAGAIRWKDRYALVARVEGRDRKSFLRWRKVRMGWIVSDSGIIRSGCREREGIGPKPVRREQMSQRPIYTICGWCSMRMAGSTGCSVRKERILQHLRAINHRR